jgi:hypothetical protein
MLQQFRSGVPSAQSSSVERRNAWWNDQRNDRGPFGQGRRPRQATGSGQCVGPASPGWATMRKQRPGSGEKASA